MPRAPGGPANGRGWQRPEVKLPKEIRRADNGRLFVEFKRRFPDGTGFRRAADFAPTAVAGALDFLDRAKEEFNRGQKSLPPDGAAGNVTVSEWCDHCLNTIMPSQSTNRRPRYSNDTLKDFREVVRDRIKPNIGSVALEALSKSQVEELVAKLETHAVRAKTLYVLTRIVESAEAKGKRKKGTNPCKGVSADRPA